MKHLLLKSALMMFALALVTQGNARAQDDLLDDPGYLDLHDVGRWFDAEPWLEVNIQGALLELAAEATRHEDPDLTDLLYKLKAIQVRGYRLDWDAYDQVERQTSDLAQSLRQKGWSTVARVRDRDERVEMYVKEHEGAIAGLVVMVLEPESDDGAIFVNIVGEIQPEQVGRIGSKFNIDSLH